MLFRRRLLRRHGWRFVRLAPSGILVLAAAYDRVLDVSAMSGIIDYQPEELVMTLRAGTPMDQLKRRSLMPGRCWPSSLQA